MVPSLDLEDERGASVSQRRRVSWRHALILLGRVRLARSNKTTTYWADLYLARSDKNYLLG